MRHDISANDFMGRNINFFVHTGDMFFGRGVCEFSHHSADFVLTVRTYRSIVISITDID